MLNKLFFQIFQVEKEPISWNDPLVRFQNGSRDTED